MLESSSAFLAPACLTPSLSWSTSLSMANNRRRERWDLFSASGPLLALLHHHPLLYAHHPTSEGESLSLRSERCQKMKTENKITGTGFEKKDHKNRLRPSFPGIAINKGFILAILCLTWESFSQPPLATPVVGNVVNVQLIIFSDPLHISISISKGPKRASCLRQHSLRYSKTIIFHL